MGTNIVLALVPLWGSVLAFAVILILLNIFTKTPNSVLRKLRMATIVWLCVGTVYILGSSPLVRPVNTLYDKQAEIDSAKLQYQEAKQPELTDESFKSEHEDISDNELFDIAKDRILNN